MKEKIFFAFRLDDVRMTRPEKETRVSLRLVSARNRHEAKAFLARHYGGQSWAVVSTKDLSRGMVHA